MDGRLFKNIAFAASGALFGALGAYYVTKKTLTEEFDKTLENETSNLNGYLRAAYADVENLTKKIEIYESAGLSYDTACLIAEKNKKLEEKAAEKLKEDMKNDISSNSKYVSYKKAYEGGGIQEEVSEEETSDSGPEVLEIKNDGDVDEHPYLISNEAFAEDHEEYRKVSCTFYTEDKVLCESSHNEKIDISNVGKENIEFFEHNNLELLYVRNDYLGIDYEIDKYDGSYTYEVLGEESLEE